MMDAPSSHDGTAATPPVRPTPRPRPVYVPAVGPGLRKLLAVVFVLTAILAANSVYLAGITFMGWWTSRTYENYFYLWMFLAHVGLGLLLIGPVVVFGILHLLRSRNRRNRRAVRIGYALFAVSLAVLLTGGLLLRIGSFQLRHPLSRQAVYWLHVACPLLTVWLYWLHRLAGPRIRWRIGLSYAALVGVVVLTMVWFQAQDPRRWNVQGPADGERYFFPSLARTTTGDFIPAKTLQMDDYCQKCHADAHRAWSQSVHRFSSFNNPAYLSSVRETRQVSLARDQDVHASRFCAGCHDPVPFFSGAFDDPNFDDVRHPTAHAGITCTVCHAITHVPTEGPRGNADYSIEEPVHYPFAFSDQPALQFINNQLVKAKPAFHKKTFLKPLHQSAEFCATCHKVHLPPELNHYKWLRGQNHYDSYLLSGVSGHGARSFYYPETAQPNCNGCHMPAKPSDDFGARFLPGTNQLSIHDHFFPSANTAIPAMTGRPDAIAPHEQFLKGIVRVDLFGLRENGTIDGKLHAPLRPDVPTLKPGETYLLDAVVRTLKLGHHFTQGTADSNEIWLEVTVRADGKIIGQSGAIRDDGSVDPWSNFFNVYMLDRDGRRIDRRNAQDIFIPLYNHQIPPGAARTVHYELRIPAGTVGPVEVEAALKYRKFDQFYLNYVVSHARPGDIPIVGYEAGKPVRNQLPIVVMATDRLLLPVAGGPRAENPTDKLPPTWQRWNDYGIGALLRGKAELRQAEEAFKEVERLGRYDGPLNLARVYFEEGRLDDATAALSRVGQFTEPAAPPWTLAWLSGRVNAEQGHLDAAIADYQAVLGMRTPEMIRRGFDFSKDYEVLNLLGQTLYQRGRQERGEAGRPAREQFFRDAVDAFRRTLALDSENVAAHYNLSLLYEELGEPDRAAEHRQLHRKFKPDDNATDRAIAIARRANPAANRAAEAIDIYRLLPPGEKPPEEQKRGQAEGVSANGAHATKGRDR